MVLCGISRCFHLLSPCLGQIVHALLTRPPLEYQPSGRNLPFDIPARLACVKHAASVRPEPGSNSDVQSLTCLPVSVHRLAKADQLQPSSKRFTHSNLTVSCTFSFLCIVFKDRVPQSRQRLGLYHISHSLSTPFFTFFRLLTKVANSRQIR